MKASIKFRDDDRPLMRAKVPIGVLGLPFQSGLSAGGDPRELRFDLSTAFSSGPALRLSYRPNDPSLPFSVSVRSGVGPLGSPARAPFSLAAEFNFLSGNPGSPAFFLLLKPRLGDFSLSHTLRSSLPPPPRKIGEVSDSGDGHEHELDYKTFSFSGSGFAADVAAAGKNGGVGALLSGMRLTTRSVLPLWGRASLRFNWGLRAPPELQAAFADDEAGVGGHSRKDERVAISKMPLLVMNKISIEQSPRADADLTRSKTESSSSPEIAAADVPDGIGHGGEGFSLVRRQLEALKAESGMLHRAVEDLRAEVASRRAVPTASIPDSWRTTPPPPPQPHHYHSFPAKPNRRSSGSDTATDNAAKPSSDELGEELKKALEARLR
ncbi:uncharacterized protein LOC102709670 [Oryza brachyantha]|uniref:uncharacterized protein LOC102709670 n=1 Tax=Oryza brachyantha TaxID=4533 RepID=UPI001AD9CA04|nr:uncharacterized protein LOC102709670 [Oryza brachyantha]